MGRLLIKQKIRKIENFFNTLKNFDLDFKRSKI